MTDTSSQPDSPPCPRCGQPMTDRDLGELEEYQCKPCQFALAPLSHMRGENKGKMLFSMIEIKCPWEEVFAHMDELEKWLKPRVGIDDEPESN
jgi:hypothetical protein